MEDQYIRQHVFEVFSEASEAIDKASDDYEDPDLTVDSVFSDSRETEKGRNVSPEDLVEGEEYLFVPIDAPNEARRVDYGGMEDGYHLFWDRGNSRMMDDQDVEASIEETYSKEETQQDVSPEQLATEGFKDEASSGLGDELDYTRQTAVQVDSVDAADTAGHEYGEQAEKTREYMEKVNQLNEKMKEIGSDRRFVHTKSDAPEEAYVYSMKGVDYYYKISDELRPSDVTEINKDDSWWLYDENERVLKTILALAEEHPEPVEEIEEVEEAYTFTDRALKTEDEVVRDEDVFTMKQQDAVVAVLVQARDFGKDDSPDRYD